MKYLPSCEACKEKHVVVKFIILLRIHCLPPATALSIRCRREEGNVEENEEKIFSQGKYKAEERLYAHVKGLIVQGFGLEITGGVKVAA